MAEVTYQVIDTGLNELEWQDEFQALARASQKAEILRKAFRACSNGPLKTDTIANIEWMHAEREGRIT